MLACESCFKGEYSIIKNPFDSYSFCQEKFEAKVFSQPVLIQVGNISSLKNQLFSAKVLFYIIKRYKDARLIFVGKAYGGYDLLLNNYISANSLNGNVEFYSETSNIPLLMSQAGYLLQPSRTESFAIVLVEAQSMGLRCFASNVIPQLHSSASIKALTSIECAGKLHPDFLTLLIDILVNIGCAVHGSILCDLIGCGFHILIQRHKIYNVDDKYERKSKNHNCYRNIDVPLCSFVCKSFHASKPPKDSSKTLPITTT